MPIVHGFGEHSGRYLNVVNYLVSKGYGEQDLLHAGLLSQAALYYEEAVATAGSDPLPLLLAWQHTTAHPG